LKTLTSAAQTIVTNQQYAYFCDLYMIRLIDKTMIYWTGADVEKKWGADTYLCGPLIERGSIAMKVGLETDSTTLTIYPRPEDMVGSTLLGRALMSGIFDSAEVQIYRGIAANPQADLADAISRFRGKISDVSGNASKAMVTIVSELYKLGQVFPRHVYAPSCGNQLFDEICALSTSAYAVNASVASASIFGDVLKLQTNETSKPNQYFRGGVAKFITGENAGRVQKVKESNASGGVFFSEPWLSPVAAGDIIQLLPGCDKKLLTCTGKFGNTNRFRGQPFVPSPETVL
jgi:uncharacterized phage protein (TIGR02218 family)